MTENRYKIYALVHPITKEIRYIGYTSKDLKIRLAYHYYDLKKDKCTHKCNWLRLLASEGLKADIILIEDNISSVSSALSKEVIYISKYPNLVNSTLGGETNKVFSEDVKRRIGQSMKGKLVGKLNPMFGKKREDLRQRNLSNNPSNNQDSVNKMAATLKAKYNTPEYKKIHMETQKTRVSVNKMDFNGNILATYPSIKKAVQDGFQTSCISLCCRGIFKQHKGFKWEYAEKV